VIIDISTFGYRFVKSLRIKDQVFFKDANLSNFVYTDFRNVYALTTTSDRASLWKIPIDLGLFGVPQEIDLPLSEFYERTNQELIEEAISEGAWET
jgi:hypothetical protein